MFETSPKYQHYISICQHPSVMLLPQLIISIKLIDRSITCHQKLTIILLGDKCPLGLILSISSDTSLVGKLVNNHQRKSIVHILNTHCDRLNRLLKITDGCMLHCIIHVYNILVLTLANRWRSDMLLYV